MDIPLSELEKAAERLKPILHHTELDLSSTFSAMTGGTVYLKCENRQKTGSFKIRGASNKIASLVEQGRTGPVVAASAGNHAQGVAYAASRLGVPATIVMPKTAPIAKLQATEGYGAKVVAAGDCFDDAYAEALRICEEEGRRDQGGAKRQMRSLNPLSARYPNAGPSEAGLRLRRKKEPADMQFSRQALIAARFSRVGMLLRIPRKRNGAGCF